MFREYYVINHFRFTTKMLDKTGLFSSEAKHKTNICVCQVVAIAKCKFYLILVYADTNHTPLARYRPGSYRDSESAQEPGNYPRPARTCE
jgi:hypothetical protein